MESYLPQVLLNQLYMEMDQYSQTPLCSLSSLSAPLSLPLYEDFLLECILEEGIMVQNQTLLSNEMEDSS
jgi:hypothetical protein